MFSLTGPTSSTSNTQVALYNQGPLALAVRNAENQLAEANLPEQHSILVDELLSAVNQRNRALIAAVGTSARAVESAHTQALTARDTALREAQGRLIELSGKIEQLTEAHTVQEQSHDQEIKTLKAKLRKEKSAQKTAEKTNEEFRVQISTLKQDMTTKELSFQKRYALCQASCGSVFDHEDWRSLGADVWTRSQNDIIPPPTIHDILREPDPWDPTRKVRETHMLFWRPFCMWDLFHFLTLEWIETLFRTPKGGGIPHKGYSRPINNPNANSEFLRNLTRIWVKEHAAMGWVLLRKEVVPGTMGVPLSKRFRNRNTYDENAALVSSKPGYSVPTAIEVIMGIFIEHMRGRPVPYGSLQVSCLRTAAKGAPPSNGEEWLVVCDDDKDLLSFHKNPPGASFGEGYNRGMGACRRFEAN